MGYNQEVFKNKTLSAIFNEIYDNAKNREEKVRLLIGELKDLVEDLQDATVLVPLIVNYLDISVKNNEQLIKLTGVVQKLENGKSDTGEALTPEFLQQLMEEDGKLNEELD